MDETQTYIGTVNDLIAALTDLPAEIRELPVRVTLPAYVSSSRVDTLSVDANSVTLS